MKDQPWPLNSAVDLPFLLNIFTLNDLHGYLVENSIQTLIIRRHIVFLVWFIKRAWAACDLSQTI